MTNIGTSLSRIMKANPVRIGAWLISSRVAGRIRSFLIGSSLSAPGLQIGPCCRIIGARCIIFGKGIYAGRELWLEAVTTYEAQSFEPKILIGDYVRFSDNVHISAIENITIGSHTLFGSKIYVSDHNHGVYAGEGQSSPNEPPAERKLGGGGPVIMGENVWVGDNSVIVGPAAVGRGAIIAANSVVRGEVPPNTMVAGVPARPIKVFNFQTGTWDKA